MQSLDEMSLDYIDRTNIKLGAFENLQEDLNGREISSFIELIWPLPGETLSSFKKGIEKLFERNASVIVVYPHLLLHNTPIYKKREEYGLQTRKVQDGASEAELVVGTERVSYEEFQEGMWFYYTVLALYNTRCLHGLSRYLHQADITPYNELYSTFVEFCKGRTENPFTQFCETSIAEADYYEVTNYPIVYYTTLHSDRAAFDGLLYDFVSSQPWWGDERARVLFEIDLFNKMYIYSNTPMTEPSIPVQHVRLSKVSNREYRVEVPEPYCELLADVVDVQEIEPQADGRCVFRVDHKRNQFPARPEQSLRDRADYCYGMIMRGAKLLPKWTTVDATTVHHNN